MNLNCRSCRRFISLTELSELSKLFELSELFISLTNLNCRSSRGRGGVITTTLMGNRFIWHETKQDIRVVPHMH